MAHESQSARRTDAEAGYVLIAVLFLVAVMLIALAVAAPRIAKSIQRDRELELIKRGEQYKRAIKLYYRKFGAYPSSIDQLMNTNQVRFLRKRYTDPMTGKDDWKIIHYGQAHIKTLGLFGQPIANSGMAGASMPGAMGPGGVAASGGAMPGSLGSPGTGLGTSGTGGTDGSTSGGLTSGSTSGGTDSGAFGSSGSGSGSAFGSGSGSAYGSSPSTGSGFGSSTGSTSGTGSSGFGSGDGSGSFGGGPIVGIVIPSTKASIKEYKQQKHYNEWEFVYDPLEDQLQAGSLFGGAPQNVNGTGTGSGFGSPTPGNGNLPYSGGSGTSGGSSFGGSSGPTSPQQ